MAKIQITGGGFQDSEGNALTNGYLVMELSQDCRVAATAQVCSGVVVNVPLDSSGNVSGTVLVWPNDQLTPSNNYYTVTGYTAAGQRAWGPNVQQIIGAGPFNLNTWIPNTITNWTPSVVTLQLQTNEINNGSQTLLDLKAGSNISLTDNGAGRVTIANTYTPPTLPTFQTNEVNNGSQTTLDLHAGSNITLADNGSGRVTISAAAVPSTLMASDKVWGTIRYSTNEGSLQLNIDTIGCLFDVQASGVGATVQSYAGNASYPSGGLVFPGTATAGAYARARAKASGTCDFGKLSFALAYAGAINVALGSNCYFAPLSLTTQGFTIWNPPPANGTDWYSANTIAIYSIGGNWLCVCRTGGAATVVDSGVAVDGNPHRFLITVNAGPSVVFSLDGVTLATISTNVPTSGPYEFTTYVQNLAGITATSQGYVGIQYFQTTW